MPSWTCKKGTLRTSLFSDRIGFLRFHIAVFLPVLVWSTRKEQKNQTSLRWSLLFGRDLFLALLKSLSHWSYTNKKFFMSNSHDKFKSLLVHLPWQSWRAFVCFDQVCSRSFWEGASHETNHSQIQGSGPGPSAQPQYLFHWKMSKMGSWGLFSCGNYFLLGVQFLGCGPEICAMHHHLLAVSFVVG